jgi:hypothetical protein
LRVKLQTHIASVPARLTNGSVLVMIRAMLEVQNGTGNPTQLDAARVGVVATRLAEVMGVYSREPGVRIGPPIVGQVLSSAAEAGIAEEVAARPDAAEPGERTTLALLEALQSSPRPAQEIEALESTLGPATLSQLVLTSEQSLRRYAGGERSTPDPIAHRLHFVAQLVAILRGSFNEFGIRRWFARPHPLLDGRTPTSLLTADWDPAEPGPLAVMQAALHLLW